MEAVADISQAFATIDDLAELTTMHRLRDEYHQAPRLLHTMSDAVMPLVKTRLNGDTAAHGDLSRRASPASMRVLRQLDESVRLARQCIREYHREPSSLETLAALLHVSDWQSSRLLTLSMDKTPRSRNHCSDILGVTNTRNQHKHVTIMLSLIHFS